eukprot:802701-Prorocentrum_lima.AAC.1
MSRHRAEECHFDVDEIMGGEAQTTQVLVRRHYRGGRNFDAVVGVDLHNGDEIQEMCRYLAEVRPLVL